MDDFPKVVVENSLPLECLLSGYLGVDCEVDQKVDSLLQNYLHLMTGFQMSLPELASCLPTAIGAYGVIGVSIN